MGVVLGADLDLPTAEATEPCGPASLSPSPALQGLSGQSLPITYDLGRRQPSWGGSQPG